MVLIQIYISSANGGVKTNYELGALNGRYRVRLVSVNYVDTGNAGAHKWIEVISSKLNLAYGARRYFIFNSQSAHTLLQYSELDFGGIDLTSGFFDIELQDITTGTQPIQFGGAVFSFDVQPMDGQAE